MRERESDNRTIEERSEREGERVERIGSDWAVHRQ
jgi:hypothetical protein